MNLRIVVIDRLIVMQHARFVRPGRRRLAMNGSAAEIDQTKHAGSGGCTIDGLDSIDDRAGITGNCMYDVLTACKGRGKSPKITRIRHHCVNRKARQTGQSIRPANDRPHIRPAGKLQQLHGAATYEAVGAKYGNGAGHCLLPAQAATWSNSSGPSQGMSISLRLA